MIFRASDIPTGELARVVYLIAGAASTALRARGATDNRLYSARPTPLALWAGLTRGNLLVLLRMMTDTIRESDRRQGTYNVRGKLRFRAARHCLSAAIRHSPLVPYGPVQGTPPLKI